MTLAEPTSIALAITVVGVLLGLSAVLSRPAGRAGVPIVLLFLGIGMLAGSEGLGHIAFADYRLSFRIGMMALVLILFDGGLNTPVAAVRRFIGPAAVLATAGVLGTAGLVAAGAHALGLGWRESFLFGAVVSSTDAAAVFSVIRGSGMTLRRRVGATLEIESGLNDPMAVMLTFGITRWAMGGAEHWYLAVLDVLLQFGIGAGLGLAIGYLGRELLRRLRLEIGGLYPVLSIALACLAFGLPTLFFGSGLLAVYAAGIVIGNGQVPFKSGLFRIHDFMAWLSQIVMFLALGLLVFPSRLLPVAPAGIALAIALVVIIRPVVVVACLAPFGFRVREMLAIGLGGLRGAVPIVLATYPVLAGVTAGSEIFDLVFFVVVASVLLQGSTARWWTKALGIEVPTPPAPPAVLEFVSKHVLNGEIVSYHVDPDVAVCGATVAEIPFPDDTAPILIVRGADLIIPRDAALLEPGDHVYLITRPASRSFMNLLFGRQEDDS